jgi:hypothetical protein
MFKGIVAILDGKSKVHKTVYLKIPEKKHKSVSKDNG